MAQDHPPSSSLSPSAFESPALPEPSDEALEVDWLPTPVAEVASLPLASPSLPPCPALCVPPEPLDAVALPPVVLEFPVASPLLVDPEASVLEAAPADELPASVPPEPPLLSQSVVQ